MSDYTDKIFVTSIHARCKCNVVDESFDTLPSSNVVSVSTGVARVAVGAPAHPGRWKKIYAWFTGKISKCTPAHQVHPRQSNFRTFFCWAGRFGGLFSSLSWGRRLKKVVNFCEEKSGPQTKSWLRLCLLACPNLLLCPGSPYSNVLGKRIRWDEKLWLADELSAASTLFDAIARAILAIRYRHA